MDAQRWETVHSVLADCLARPTGQRAGFVAERCAGDSELHREVLSLLRASTGADDYFEGLADRTEELAVRGAAAPMLDRDVGHFRITGVLGSGGMGEVYRARDTKLHRDVALKVLTDPGETPDAQLMARFDREATMLASINHPNIAAIYGREELDGRPVLVLELIEGVTLEERLESGPLHVNEVLEFGRQMAAGLEAAHEQGVIHRDLKPSNVMLTRRGFVKLLDFGIAKPVAPTSMGPQFTALTGTGVLLGTVPYMSPEQVRGKDLDQRADVWSFGCLLYEMLAGRRAFERETVADTLAAILEHHPPADQLPESTPSSMEELIGKAVAKAPEDRLPSVNEARRQIEEIIALRNSGEFSLTLATADVLERARQYGAQYSWQEAFDILDKAFGSLEADDLGLLGEAAWWIGDLERSMEADERAFTLYLAAADNDGAARMAIRMADNHDRKLEPAIANGWLRRAERLLDGEALSTTHGWLLRSKILRSYAEGDYESAAALADRMLEIGNELRSVDLQAVGIHYQGFTLLKTGHTSEGMKLVDEAAVAAINGELSPDATAVIYCNAISACRSLADYRRAGEWTEAAKRWCERQAIAGFPGICRVVRAEVMRLHGHWSDAEQEALKACTELETFAPSAARVAFHELGEVRLRLGDLDAARTAFDAARQMGRDPQPGASLLKLAEGDVEGAAASIRRALRNESTDAFARARLLPAQVEIALAAGDFDTARVACGEVGCISDEFDTPVLVAAAAHCHGQLCLAEGDVAGATEHLVRATGLWEAASVPYEAARARELLGRAHADDGDVASAMLELQAACETFVELGAVPDSRRAAEELAEHSC